MFRDLYRSNQANFCQGEAVDGLLRRSIRGSKEDPSGSGDLFLGKMGISTISLLTVPSADMDTFGDVLGLTNAVTV
ncbi:hypothetical protein [Novipirellula artificiosorum]|nr:hypothetical protein [Novipirellula artificiosorum]